MQFLMQVRNNTVRIQFQLQLGNQQIRNQNIFQHSPQTGAYNNAHNCFTKYCTLKEGKKPLQQSFSEKQQPYQIPSLHRNQLLTSNDMILTINNNTNNELLTSNNSELLVSSSSKCLPSIIIVSVLSIMTIVSAFQEQITTSQEALLENVSSKDKQRQKRKERFFGSDQMQKYGKVNRDQKKKKVSFLYSEIFFFLKE